jgi:hypothetical protein
VGCGARRCWRSTGCTSTSTGDIEIAAGRVKSGWGKATVLGEVTVKNSLRTSRPRPSATCGHAVLILHAVATDFVWVAFTGSAGSALGD